MSDDKSVTVPGELLAATLELAESLKSNYMLPNTWPASVRFLAAVEALDGSAAADGPQGQDDSPNAARPAPSADDDVPVGPLPQDTPERQSRAPLT